MDLCDLSVARAAGLIRRRELAPTELVRAALARIEALEPAIRAWQLVDGEGGPTDSIRMVKAAGHNADMCVVTLDGAGDAKGVFLADLVPTSAHVPLPWIMAYDLYPMTTLANRKLWYPRLAAEKWVCFFEHDYETPVGRIVEPRPGRFEAAPL